MTARSGTTVLSIVTVLYKSENMLRQTLPTWARSARLDRVEFLFVDNDPLLGCEFLAATATLGQAPVRYVRRPDNPGFAASSNLGAELAQGSHVLMLNADVWLEDDSLARVVEAVENSPEHLIAISMAMRGGTFCGVTLNPLGIMVDREAGRGTRGLLGPSGGAGVYPKEVYLRAGGLHEPLFAWGEDVDLALRLRADGHRTVPLHLSLRHDWGHTLEADATVPALKTYLMARNRLIVAARCFSLPLLLLVLTLWVPFHLALAVRKARRGQLAPLVRGLGEGSLRLRDSRSRTRGARRFRITDVIRLSFSDRGTHRHRSGTASAKRRGATRQPVPLWCSGTEQTSSEVPLSRTTARGARTMLVGQCGRLLIQIASLVVLSRLLQPAEFGYLAVAAAVIGVGEVLRDLGLSSAAVQSRALTPAQRDNLLWINVSIGTLLTLVTVLVSEVVADIFDSPPLAQIMPVLAVLFVVNGFTAQYRASLNRDMDFRGLAITELGAAAAGFGVAVVTAMAGLGYWALVAQHITVAVVAGAILLRLSPWLPGRPARQVGTMPLVTFGANVAAAQVVDHVSNNVDTLVLGYVSSPAAVGAYSRAFQMMITPLDQLRAPAVAVALPTLARVAGDDRRFSLYLTSAQAVIGYTVIPCAALLGGAAEPVVSLVLS